MILEELLQEKYREQEPQVHDDNLPDAFDAWIESLDVDEVMNYAKDYELIPSV